MRAKRGKVERPTQDPFDALGVDPLKEYKVCSNRWAREMGLISYSIPYFLFIFYIICVELYVTFVLSFWNGQDPPERADWYVSSSFARWLLFEQFVRLFGTRLLYLDYFRKSRCHSKEPAQVGQSNKACKGDGYMICDLQFWQPYHVFATNPLLRGIIGLIPCTRKDTELELQRRLGQSRFRRYWVQSDQ